MWLHLERETRDKTDHGRFRMRSTPCFEAMTETVLFTRLLQALPARVVERLQDGDHDHA
jgi:hypothetical protein